METVRSTLAYTNRDANRPVSQSAAPGDSSDPVRDGELFIQETDVTLPGPIPLQYRRTYRSRTRHLSVVGFGWDHNFNQRVIPGDNCGDVDVLTGDSSRIRFTVGKATDTSVFYNTPAGIPLSLAKNISTDQSATNWILRDGNALKYTFDYRGLLISIVDKEGHSIRVFWDHVDRLITDNNGPTLSPLPPGSDLEWRVDYVLDSTGRPIYFNYQPNTRIKTGWFLRCLTSPTLSRTCDRDVLVTYDVLAEGSADTFGNLTKVTRADGQFKTYEYYEPPPSMSGGGTSSSTYLGDDDADAYCESVCASPSDCHGSPLCGRVSKDCVDFLSNQQKAGGNIAQVCADSLLGEQQCTRTPVNHPVPIKITPICEFPAPDTTNACTQTCYANLLKNADWGGSHGACGIIQDGYHLPGWAFEKYCFFGDFFNHINEPTFDLAYCSQLCLAQDKCVGSIDSLCAVINDGAIPFCEGNGFGGGSCTDKCLSRYHYKDASGQNVLAFGQPEDLNHNLIRIRNTDDEIIQYNVYGNVVTDSSFDKVVSQQLGDRTEDTLIYHYVDYAHNAFSLAGSGGLLQLIEIIPNLPGALSTITQRMISGLGGASTLSAPWLDSFASLTYFPWARFVDSLDSFRSVAICPATCTKSKPIIRLPPVPYIPPPVVQLPTTVLGSLPVAVLPKEGNVVRLAIPAAGAPMSGTVSIGSMVPLVMDGLVVDLSRLSGVPSAATSQLSQPLANQQGQASQADRHGQRGHREGDHDVDDPPATVLRLRPLQKPGDYKLHGNESLIKLLTKETATPQVLVLFAGRLTFPFPIFNPAPIPPDLKTRATCDEWSYSAPWVGNAVPLDPQIPTHAVVVQDLHGVVRSQYYDATGRVLREVNNHTTDGNPKEVTDYNYDPISGALQGIRYPGGQRSCHETDWLARPTQSTTLPAPGAPGSAQPDIAVYEYGVYPYPWGSSGIVPPLSDVIRDPHSASPALVHFERDSYERVLEQRVQVDPTHQASTFYVYDPPPTFGPRLSTSPSKSVTALDNYTPGGPSLITQGANGPDPVTTQITYDSYNRATEVRRRNHVGATHRIADARGIPSTIGTTSPLSGQWVDANYLDYEINDRPRTIDGPTSVLKLRYSPLGYPRWQVEVAKPLGGIIPPNPRATCWNYAADGRLESVLEPEGNIRNYFYDDGGRLLRVEEGYPPSLPDWANACVTDLQSKNLPTPNLAPATTNMRGYEVTGTRSYDAAGLLVRVADGSGLGRTIINDGLGRPIDVIDDRDVHGRRGYDARGRVIWKAVYGPNPPPYGKPVGLASGVPLQAMVEYAYDNADRATEIDSWHFVGAQSVDPAKLATVTSVIYDDAHAAVSTSVDGRPPTITKTDGVGRPIATTLPTTGSTATWSWQENGAVGDQITRTLTGPDGNPRTFYEYIDDAGRLVERDDAGHVVLLQLDYDGQGRLFRRVVGNHLQTRDYDAFGRVSAQTEIGSFGQIRIGNTWDGNDRLAAVTDQSGGTTSYFYDGTGRKARALHPEGLASVWHYYAGSERIHDTTDQWGISHTFGYDLSANLSSDHAAVTSSLLSLRAQDRTFTYTPLGQIETAMLSGNPSNLTNGTQVTISYDSLGNRVSEVSSRSPVSIAQTWGPLGGASTTQLAFQGGRTAPALIERMFDDIGRLTSASINKRPVVTRGYESNGGKATFGSGAIVEQPRFDARGRQVGLDVTLAADPVASLHDVLGIDGVVRERQRSFSGAPPLTDLYQQDDAGRLKGEIVGSRQYSSVPVPGPDVTDDQLAPYLQNLPNGGQGQGSFNLYSLDGDANWLSKTDLFGTHAASFTSPAGLNQYSLFGRDSNGSDGAEWHYTAGNATQVGADSYTYDVFGQLTSATTANGSIVFAYDALGRRVLEQNVATGTISDVVWDGAEIAAIGAPNDPSTYVIRVGANGLDEHLAIANGFGAGEIVFLHRGPDGSVLAATDESGLREGYAYSGYGETTFFDSRGASIARSAVGNRYLFQGQLYDPLVGAYAMRAREYRPDVGRFLSPDPIGIAGGENLYAFVLGRPLAFSDRFGLSPQNAIQPSVSNGVGNWVSNRLDIARNNAQLFTGFPKEFGRWFVENHHVPDWDEAGDGLLGQGQGLLEGFTGLRDRRVQGNATFEKNRDWARGVGSFLFRATVASEGGGGAPALAYASGGVTATSITATQATMAALAATARPNADLTLQNSSGNSNQSTGAGKPAVPQKATSVVAQIRAGGGNAPAGYVGNRSFLNDGRNGGVVLPRTDSVGSPITYKEYDVNPFQPGVNRGAERVVMGSDGSAYYTADHYMTFVPVP